MDKILVFTIFLLIIIVNNGCIQNSNIEKVGGCEVIMRIEHNNDDLEEEEIISILKNKVFSMTVQRFNVEHIGENRYRMKIRNFSYSDSNLLKLFFTSSEITIYESYFNVDVIPEIEKIINDLDIQFGINREVDTGNDYLMEQLYKSSDNFRDLSLKDFVTSYPFFNYLEASFISPKEIEMDTIGVTGDTNAGKLDWEVLANSALAEPNSIFYKSLIIGTARVEDTGIVNRYLKVIREKISFSNDIRFLWNFTTDVDRSIKLYAIKDNLFHEMIEKESFLYAHMDESYPLGYTVDIQLTPYGREVFKEMTRRNMGKHLAITVSDGIFVTPKVESEIHNGAFVISFDHEGAARFLEGYINYINVNLPFQIRFLSFKDIRPSYMIKKPELL